MSEIMILAVTVSVGCAIGQIICLLILKVTFNEVIERTYWQTVGIFTFALAVGLRAQP